MNKFDNEKIYYDYGQLIDLDGITPQEIVENIQNAGSQKTKITINGIVSKGNDDEYNIIFTPTSTLQDIVKLSITINGITDVVEMSSKDSELVYGPVDKYCSAIIDVSPYSSKTAKYYTTFKNENGNGLFNVTLIATKNNQETIVETKQYKYNTNVEIETPIFEGYSFNKWEIIPNTINIVESNEENIKFIIGEEDIILKCHYDVAMYTVTWKDENGEVLETDENVPYGTTPEYNGETPTKQEDQQYTYEFSGWDKEFESVTEDIVCTATYDRVIKQYTLNIEVINGTSNIENGTKFDYSTNIEVKLTANEGYSVNGGTDRETVVIKNVTIEGDTTINHEFMINMYDITFVDHNDNSIETLSINYNEKLVVPSDIEPSDYEDEQYVWKFNGSWNPEINENTKVLGDQTYKAQYSPELRTFELGIKVENGTYNISSRDGNETYTYGEIVEVTIIPNEGYSIDGKPTETYEVVITEDTELTYVCDLITYSLTVNEDFKGNFTPNDDISSYLTYTEEENKIHSWMEGDVEFTDTIMPDRDLILTSKYTEKPVEDIMIYYGSKLINELDTFNNENITNNLNSFTYDETITEYGNLTPPFKQPTLNNDNVWEEFYDKNDSSIWNENGFVNCVLAPNNLTVNLSVDGTNLNTINQYNTYTINGIEYNLYIGQPSQPYDSYFNGSGAEYTNAIIIITQ